jgi:hypothetical protein
LGYHYDPIDYIFDGYFITNATLTLTNGVAVAVYTNNSAGGISLRDGSGIVSVGAPLAPNWIVRHTSAQEQPVAGASLYPVLPRVGGGTAPSGHYRFTKFACPAGSGYHLYHRDATWSYGDLSVQDCEFWSGKNEFSGSTNTKATLKNNLFYRTTFNASGSVSPNSSLSVSNNLFIGITNPATAITLTQPSGSAWYAFNNDFDACKIALLARCTNGYNAYINCVNRINPPSSRDLVLSSPIQYVSGPLGDFYQLTNSPLVNTGSVTAELTGLYHYTVTTNLVNDQQIKETNSVVDIGYHYVAVDNNWNPLDADGDGMPDYLEDANGNGQVELGESSWTNYNSASGLTSANALLVFTPLK